MGSQRLYSGFQVFPDPSDDRLAELAQWQLVFTFLAAYSIKVDVTSNISSYDQMIFENLLLCILFFAPAISFLDPVMGYICGKPVALAQIDLGTVGLEAPSLPQEMQEAMKVAKQVEAANKKSIKKGKAPVTEYTTSDVVLSGAKVDSGDGRSYLILLNSKLNSIILYLILFNSI